MKDMLDIIIGYFERFCLQIVNFVINIDCTANNETEPRNIALEEVAEYFFSA